MKVDALVVKRMSELIAKGEVISAAREHEFNSLEGKPYFKVPRSAATGWSTSVLNLLVRVFGEDGPHCANFKKHVPEEWWESSFADLKAILVAAKEDYEGGYLFNVRGLILSEAFADLLAQADALLESNYIIGAGALGRAALEQHLRSWADTRGLIEEKPNGKPPMIGDYILWLKKGDVINAIQRAHLEAMAKVGNSAAHADPTVARDDVARMLRDVRDFLAKNPIT